MGCAFYILKFLSENRLFAAKSLLLFTTSAYIFSVSCFASGYGTTHNGIVHIWFIFLSILSFFLLYNYKPLIRDLIPVMYLILYFVFEFGFIPVHLVYQLSPKETEIVNMITVITFSTVVFWSTRFYVIKITEAEATLSATADQLEGLIESTFPKKIAERIKQEGGTFSDEYPHCSVLFADVVGFTSWSENRVPNEVVDYLNDLFSKFDEATEKRSLTKIKTIGDAYMVASGIPDSNQQHAENLVELALDFQNIALEENNLTFRIGIHSGPVTAGIIGKKGFNYDLWGDTVNTAARMESSGIPGKINISDSTFQIVKDKFRCTYRGKIEAKNKGMIDMYLVEERK